MYPSLVLFSDRRGAESKRVFDVFEKAKKRNSRSRPLKSTCSFPGDTHMKRLAPVQKPSRSHLDPSDLFLAGHVSGPSFFSPISTSTIQVSSSLVHADSLHALFTNP